MTAKLVCPNGHSDLELDHTFVKESVTFKYPDFRYDILPGETVQRNYKCRICGQYAVEVVATVTPATKRAEGE